MQMTACNFLLCILHYRLHFSLSFCFLIVNLEIFKEAAIQHNPDDQDEEARGLSYQF
jgi:hypothetical protein